MKERRGVDLQFHSFLPLAVDGVSGHFHAPTVIPRETDSSAIEWQGRYTTELLLTLQRRDKSLASPRN